MSRNLHWRHTYHLFLLLEESDFLQVPTIISSKIYQAATDTPDGLHEVAGSFLSQLQKAVRGMKLPLLMWQRQVVAVGKPEFLAKLVLAVANAVWNNNPIKVCLCAVSFLTLPGSQPSLKGFTSFAK